MSKKTKTRSRGAVPQVDPYLDGLMAKLMDRLGALERKLDTVIAQTAGRPQDRSAQPGHNPSYQGPRPAQTQQVFSRPIAPLEPKHPSRHDRTMYEAVCADCSDPCEVPFRPSPDRAIYCKPCFAKRRAEGRVHPSQPSQGQGRPQGPQGPGGSGSSAAVMTAPAVKSADKVQAVSKDAKSASKSKSAAAKPASAKPAKKAKKK